MQGRQNAQPARVAPHTNRARVREEEVMSVKVFCKLADCVNWDNGVCGAEEIRIDREGYCATYEEIPEEAGDELDLPSHVEDLNWEDEDEEDLEIDELGEDTWSDLDEEDEEEEEEGIDDERWKH
jgi:hypothetical protein